MREPDIKWALDLASVTADKSWWNESTGVQEDINIMAASLLEARAVEAQERADQMESSSKVSGSEDFKRHIQYAIDQVVLGLRERAAELRRMAQKVRDDGE